MLVALEGPSDCLRAFFNRVKYRRELMCLRDLVLGSISSGLLSRSVMTGF